PVIVDPDNDEVYFTPLYYTMAHFSKYIRPGATRIGFEHQDKDLLVTAVQNTDKSIVAVVFNPSLESKSILISLDGKSSQVTIRPNAIQSIIVANK
ncbi:MAG: glycoside hydrolase family 30 protein, partial [Saprospiraceae bacterium]